MRRPRRPADPRHIVLPILLHRADLTDTSPQLGSVSSVASSDSLQSGSLVGVHASVGVSSISASSFERGAGTGVADLFYLLLTPFLAWCTLCNLVLFAIARIVPHPVSCLSMATVGTIV